LPGERGVPGVETGVVMKAYKRRNLMEHFFRVERHFSVGVSGLRPILFKYMAVELVRSIMATERENYS
jgi:hypothetical protein